MNTYIAYLRVSTTRQGTTGVSLTEQRLAISHYANTHSLRIVRWCTEVQSASRKRPVFDAALKSIRNKKAAGLLVHKIDRGARSLGDWARIGELLDAGADVRFVHDDLDLHSRGGRLAADIQAVIAADFVRNLREETRKGILGRLRQGLFPAPAPFGYLNNGRGKPKTPDPKHAPIVREAFELYSSGSWTIRRLATEMYGRGIRNSRGQAIGPGGWSHILSNRFYVGELRVKGSVEILPGVHEPLVSWGTFDRVQRILRSRSRRDQRSKHHYLYSRRLRCVPCGRMLIGEMQKGRVYYRCHGRSCPHSIREDRVEEALRSQNMLGNTAHFVFESSLGIDTTCT